MLMIGSTRLAQEVHAAWRDGMIDQGREVSAERMTWETLSEQDKALDKYIGGRLARLFQALPVVACSCPAGSYNPPNVHEPECALWHK